MKKDKTNLVLYVAISMLVVLNTQIGGGLL